MTLMSHIYKCESCDGTEGSPWDCDGCAGVGFIGNNGPFISRFSKEAITPEQQEEELRLWRRWRIGDRAALGQLMNMYQPILNKWYGRVSHAKLPPSALRGELEIQLIRAFERYDPHRGVKLSTWVESNMPKIFRMVYEHQNIGRIPEHRVRRISEFQAAKSKLSEDLHREPTALELSDSLGWKIDEISTLERELRKDLSQSGDFEDMIISTPSVREAMHWAYRELTGRDRIVFEWLTGWGGKTVISQTEIAQRLGISPATVTKIRQKIVDKIRGAEGVL